MIFVAVTANIDTARLNTDWYLFWKKCLMFWICTPIRNINWDTNKIFTIKRQYLRNHKHPLSGKKALSYKWCLPSGTIFFFYALPHPRKLMTCNKVLVKPLPKLTFVLKCSFLAWHFNSTSFELLDHRSTSTTCRQLCLIAADPPVSWLSYGC